MRETELQTTNMGFWFYFWGKMSEMFSHDILNYGVKAVQVWKNQSQ